MDGRRQDSDCVVVERGLLREILADGCCPLHLRLRLSRLLGGAGLPDASKPCTEAYDGDCAASQIVEVEPNQQALAEENKELSVRHAFFEDLSMHCLATVSANLPLAEVLEVRACSREALQWVMQRGTEEHGPRNWIHNRIRARLWIRRVADVTAGTRDESIFETRLRTFADDALRSRMENEMQEALQTMEEQIHQFQTEVDRRLEEQERHVRRMVEERVQQELDAILASEVVKVQATIERRVRERVGATFHREVQQTVTELETKLNQLVEENDLLKDAFAEANLRAKCMFWAVNPLMMYSSRLTLGLLGGANSFLSIKRRSVLAAAFHPPIERLAAQGVRSAPQQSVA